MQDLADGESYSMQGSASKPYILKNIGGVYSCTCPAWGNQSLAIEQRTCKHLRKLRGDAAENTRIGAFGATPAPRKAAASGEEKEGPPVLLAESWDNVLDLTGWWMSEKLDGVRAYWDGKQFLSRQGNRYHAPDWFIEGLPDTPLDGELWLDRGKFQVAVGIAKRQDKPDTWKQLRFVIFDAPALPDDFETRMRFYQDYINLHNPAFAVAHSQAPCTSLDHLRGELDRVITLGGEGLMLRQPRSKYAAGRSSTLLKVKRFHDDEARVIGHQPGAGRHKGRLGALLVALPNGVEFGVGTGFSDKEREVPPPIGSTITFRYQELTEGGVPRFPSYLGIRHDATAGAAAKPRPAPATKVAMPLKEEVKPTTGRKRYFELVEGTSSKFWEVWQSGCDMTTRWGKIGTAGQSKTKAFKDEAAAAAVVAKLIEEKTGDGYVEKRASGV
jgi:DNA ligase 1